MSAARFPQTCQRPLALAAWLSLAGIGPAWAAQAGPLAEAMEEDSVEADVEADAGWRLSGNTQAWLYGTHSGLSAASLLNPGNRLANLARDQAWLDVRLNGRAERGPLEAVGALRLLSQRSLVERAGAPLQRDSDDSLQLVQAFVRHRHGEGVLTAGRELLSWGPATFRSPSNPFYFDAGRTNPLASTPGVDLLRYNQQLAPGWRAGGGYVFSTSQITPATELGHSVWFKLDQQGASHLVSLVLSQPRGGSTFIGGFAQWTPDDAWLLYGEFGRTRQPGQLQPLAAGPGPLYRWQQPAPRSSDSLLGASYTLESGHVLSSEWLHSGAGYSAAGQAAYWAQARRADALLASNPALGDASLGQALGQAPRLLGRDYLWLGLQSNPQESGLYWRLEYSRQLADRSGRVMAYAEKKFLPQVSGFTVLSRNTGSPASEFGSLLRTRLTLGLKLFLL